MLGLLLFAGCGGSPTPAPPLGNQVVPPGSSDLAVVAIGDMARRLGIHSSQVSVAKVELVDWPDASLGCPQPDTAYAQVVTPGYLILLVTRAQTYEYHSDRTSQVVFCPPTPQGQP